MQSRRVGSGARSCGSSNLRISLVVIVYLRLWQAAQRIGHQNTRKYGGQQTARTMRDVTATDGLSPYLTKIIVSYLALFASPLKFDSLKQIELGSKSFIVIDIKQNPTN